jgi:hypothetical protein
MRLWLIFAALAAVQFASAVQAQGGPPYLTTDPGTPGNGNWEINVGAMATRVGGLTSYQLPQLDVNFGVGDRIQLTVEVPYVLQTDGASVQGWGNAFIGVKWRFLDQGEEGWQMSTFPQLETAGSAPARAEGIAIAGPRWLLPLEVTHKAGPLDLNLEVGYYFPRNGPNERFLGFVVGHTVSERLEVDAEIYADRASGAPPNDTTLDVGFRYKLHPAFILLCMAGRSISGDSASHTQFMGYLGLQVLLSDYGLHLMREP